MQQNPYFNYYQRPQQIQAMPGLKGYLVSSIDEARAANIDFDGSIMFFPDLTNNKIYTKQILPNGQLAFNLYELKVVQPKEEIKTEKYVTYADFQQLLHFLQDNCTNGQVLTKEKIEELVQRF